MHLYNCLSMFFFSRVVTIPEHSKSLSIPAHTNQNLWSQTVGSITLINYYGNGAQCSGVDISNLMDGILRGNF